MRQIAEEKRLPSDIDAQPVVQAAAALRSIIRGHHEGSNWRANSSGVRPFRTKSMMRRRNSGGYVDGPFPTNHGVFTKPGQLHSRPQKPSA